MEQVHGHEVIRMMLTSNKAYTKASLEDEIITTFGKGTLFYTCSASNLSPKELVDFLVKRGKLVHTKDCFKTSENLICSH